MRSLRLSFDNRDPSDLKLTAVVRSLALPPPADDPANRGRMTGCWIQLEDRDGAILHLEDLPGLMHPLSQDVPTDELRSFDARVPYLQDAATVAVFAPPRVGTDARPLLGAPSALVKRFPLPLPEDRSGAPPVVLPSDICGKGRGQVLSVTNVVHHGTIENVYNFVVLGDKFDASEQESFASRASDCVNYLLSRPPFTSVFGSDAVNIFYVHVASNSSDPSYFNSTYSDPDRPTTVDWDTGCVKKVCDALFSVNGTPYWDWAGILINFDGKRIGTSRGDQFASGLYAKRGAKVKEYVQVFQHEFGHSAFRVGDEYGGKDGTYSGVEPNWPNQTIATVAADLKWKDFLTPGVRIPTLGNPPDCGRKDSRKNPVRNSTVGSYAGASTAGGRYSCGIYHPQYVCVMNDEVRADGAYCVVCLHQATKIVARAIALFVPAPGSIYYSPRSEDWSHDLVAANVIENYKDLPNYPDYGDVVKELRARTAGTAVQSAFTAAGHPVPNDLEVVHSFGDGDSDNLWYLISRATLDTYFVHAYQVAKETNLHTGRIKLPDFPGLTLFDGAVVGTQINLFSGDGGFLSSGVLDPSGNLIGAGMAPQTVPGLKQNVSALSVAYVQSRIWVAVVDELDVKIAAYELSSGAWWGKGFLTMPVATATDFHTVKIEQAGSTIHAIAQAASGLWYASFDTIEGAWNGEPATTPVTGSVAYYDIGVAGDEIYLIANASAATLSYGYAIDAKTWSDPVDITTAIGLQPGSVVSSLGTTVLGKKLYLIALVNQLPDYAIYDIPSRTWTNPLGEIRPLESLARKMGAMTVHATRTQVYVGLSAI